MRSAGSSHNRTVLPGCGALPAPDGAPIGGEAEQALRIVSLANAACASSAVSVPNACGRVGVRVQPVGHAANALRYIMVPKVEAVDDVVQAVAAIDVTTPPALHASPLPIHVLIESPAAVHHAFEIAAHPRVQFLSFGLMDFVSAHGAAIPSVAMSVRPVGDTHSQDQFHHPLVLRAKMEITSACRAHGKVPSPSMH